MSISIDIVCDNQDCDEGDCTGMETVEEARKWAQTHAGWTSRQGDLGPEDICPKCSEKSQ